MKISCPSCSQRIEISGEAYESLRGMPEFECPACGGSVPLPEVKPDGSLDGMAADQLLMRGIKTPQLSGDGAWEPPTPEKLSELIDSRYEVLRLLGRGGMGAVYQARDARLGRLVAIKILPQALVDQLGAMARFEREARALAALDHPHIVKVHDYGLASDGTPYFVMEFVKGRDIQSLRDGGELDLPNALRLISETCSALHYAHLRGIVHRDIKPANILVTHDGSAKVADFGLARVTATDSRPLSDAGLTLTGQVMGTPSYMAPEQEAGETVDHRSDIYALGVTLYNLLTGAPPRGAWSLPSQKLHIDVRLDEIVLRALQEKPEARYQAAQEFQTDLDSVRSQTGGSALPSGISPEPLPSSGGGKPLTSHHDRSSVRVTVPRTGTLSSQEDYLATTRSLNTTMLVLGLIAMLTIGGLALYLADRKTGSTTNSELNIINSFINNTYFTRLIASGATTVKDLEAVMDLRPCGDGFVGISKEPLDWEQARELAERTGARILDLQEEPGNGQTMLDWLKNNYSAHLTSRVWVRSENEPRVLDGPDVLAATAMDSPRKVLLAWGLAKAQGTGTADVLLHYDFADATGNMVTDQSGNGHHGTLRGFADTEPKVGDGTDSGRTSVGNLRLDGKDDHIITPVAVKELGTGDFTLEAIVSHSDPGSRFQHAIASDTPDFNDPGAINLSKMSANYPGFPSTAITIRYNGMGTNTINSTTPTDLCNGQLHHLALVRDVQSAEIRIYFDHTVVDRFQKIRGSLNAGENPNNPCFIIGGSGWGDKGYWHGLISEIRITKRALTPADFISLPVKSP